MTSHLPSNRPYSSTDLFDVVTTFQEAVFIVAYFNIQPERSDDPITKRLRPTDLLCDYTGFQFDAVIEYRGLYRLPVYTGYLSISPDLIMMS